MGPVAGGLGVHVTSQVFPVYLDELELGSGRSEGGPPAGLVAAPSQRILEGGWTRRDGRVRRDSSGRLMQVGRWSSMPRYHRLPGFSTRARSAGLR
jgi:hypothetical protein